MLVFELSYILFVRTQNEYKQTITGFIAKNLDMRSTLKIKTKNINKKYLKNFSYLIANTHFQKFEVFAVLLKHLSLK